VGWSSDLLKKELGCRCSSWGTVQSCSMSRYQLPVTVLSKEKWPDDHAAHDAIPNIQFQALSHMFHDALQCCDPHIWMLCLFTASEIWKVATPENVKCVGKLGLYRFSQASHRQNCVSISCPLDSAPAESVPCMQRDTTTFGEPHAQLLVASAVPMKLNELISLDFGCTPYGLSLASHQRHVSLFHAFQDDPSL
jgi:hypothetical protein